MAQRDTKRGVLGGGDNIVVRKAGNLTRDNDAGLGTIDVCREAIRGSNNRIAILANNMAEGGLAFPA